MRTIHERIEHIRDIFCAGKNTTMANELSCNEANIRSYTNGTLPKADMIERIVIKYDISADWLLTGRGEMIKTSNSPKILTEIVEHRNFSPETRPRIPINAAAGSLSVCLDGITASKCEQMPVIAAFSRYDFTIYVHGDSMVPQYYAGDELAGLYVKNTSFIQWGKTHILDTEQGVIVKNIFEDGDCILCKSANDYYKDFRIPKSEVFNIALVIGVIRRC